MRATTIALALGLVATNAFARNFPYRPSPSQPAGIKEQGKYTMAVRGTHAAVPYWPLPSRDVADGGTQIGLPDPTWGIAARPGPASRPGGTIGSSTNPVAFLRSVGKGTAEVTRVMPDATTTPPATSSANRRTLAVHLDAETFYVTFGSDDERREYVKDLRSAVEKAGLSIKR